MSRELNNLLRSAVDTGAVVGVVAGTIDASGLRHLAAYGMRDAHSGASMEVDTLFWIASMTKVVTSVAAMQAVSTGQIELDAPAGLIFPAIANPSILMGFDDAGLPILDRARTPITVRHLLTHTAGYGYDTWNTDILLAARALGLPRRPVSDADIAKTPLLFEPGLRLNYSIATDILSRVLECAEGQHFDTIFNDRIFGPLGMYDTGFLVAPVNKSRMAAIHRRTGCGFAAYGPAAVGDGQGYAGGGGGLVSSVPDYLRFLQALLRGNLISCASWGDMTRNQIGKLRAGRLMTCQPTLSFDVDLLPGQSAGWGLGFLVNPERTPTRRSPGSLAWAGLANTYFWIDLERGVASVLATQMLPFADARVVDLLNAYERQWNSA